MSYSFWPYKHYMFLLGFFLLAFMPQASFSHEEQWAGDPPPSSLPVDFQKQWLEVFGDVSVYDIENRAFPVHLKDAFTSQSAVQERLHMGQHYFDAVLMDRALAFQKQLLQEQPFWVGNPVQYILDLLQQEQKRQLAPISPYEAEQKAKQQIYQKYPGISRWEQDPGIRREYQVALNRASLEEKSSRNSKNKSEQHQKKMVSEIAQRLRKEVIGLSSRILLSKLLGLKDKKIILHFKDENQKQLHIPLEEKLIKNIRLFNPARSNTYNEMIFGELSSGPKLFKLTVESPKSESSGLQGYVLPYCAPVKVDRSFHEFELVSGNILSLLPSVDLMDYAVARLLENGAFALLTGINRMANDPNTSLIKLKETMQTRRKVDHAYGLEAKISKILGSQRQESWEAKELIRFYHDAKGRPHPLEKLILLDLAKKKPVEPPPLPFRFHTPTQGPSNYKKSKKFEIFKVSKTSTDPKPLSFLITHSKKISRSDPSIVPFASGVGDLKLLSTEAIVSNDGIIPLPTPDSHELETLNMKDKKTGELLVLGKDYTLRRSGYDSGYYIIPAKNNSYELEISFKKIKDEHPLKDKVLQNLDLSHLKKLSQSLKEAGFEALSQRLFSEISIRELNKVPFNVFSLERLFQESAYYSNIPEKKTAMNSKNIFSNLSKFLNEGVACYQCTGAQKLFAAFMGEYFKKYPHYKIQKRDVFLVIGDSLKNSDFHSQNEIRLFDERIFILDTTPSILDPRELEETSLALKKEREAYFLKLTQDLDQKGESLIRLMEKRGRMKLDPTEPLRRVIPLSRSLQNLIKGAVEESSVEARIQGIIEETEKMKYGLQKMVSENRLPGHSPYYEFEVKETLDELMDEILKVSRTLNVAELKEHWAAQKKNGPACTEGSLLKEVLVEVNSQ